MKIVITGSHSVGKTTLSWQLLQYLNAISFPKEDMMQIGVTGSHGTGKTTLSKLLTGRYKYKFLPETPFQAFQRGFTMNEQTDVPTELWIFAKQVEQEQNAGGNWVADKCMIDLLAYAHYFFGQDESLIDVLTRVAVRSFKLYELVLYLPIEFPIEDDGFRSTNLGFQRAIDFEIQSVLKQFDIPFHTVRGLPEERFSYVKGLLQ